MQSGFKRKNYDVGPCPPGAASAFSSGSKKRERCITGLATDALNRVLIASTLDGTVNVRLLYICLNHTNYGPSSSSISKQQNWNKLLCYLPRPCP